MSTAILKWLAVIYHMRLFVEPDARIRGVLSLIE
jgi:hypothetical protein